MDHLPGEPAINRRPKQRRQNLTNAAQQANQDDSPRWPGPAPGSRPYPSRAGLSRFRTLKPINSPLRSKARLGSGQKKKPPVAKRESFQGL